MARLIDIIFELILVIVVVRMLLSAIRTLWGSGRTRFSPPGSSSSRQEKETTQAPTHGETARDPVCGMFVSTELSHQLKWNGSLLHFCSEECLKQYQKRASA